MFKVIRTFAKDGSGATAIEYGLIAALVSVCGARRVDCDGGLLVDHVQHGFQRTD